MDVGGNPTEQEATLYQGVGELARFINQAHLNLAETMQPQGDGTAEEASDIAVTAKDLPTAHDMLRTVTEETEAATMTVMTHAETTTNSINDIRALLTQLGPTTDRQQADTADELTRQLLARLDSIEAAQDDTIMAMSFQDLTGQKIKQVISLMGQVEERILRLVVEYGIASAADTSDKDKEKRLKDVDESGLQQTNVDDILAEFGF